VYNGKKILSLIPARGGSKGIPGKNIRILAGKPLIAWTIEEAKKSKYIDRLILSSEDSEIIKVAIEWGCEVPFVRPSELARDDTPSIELVIHAINTLNEKYDYIVLLQPTSPLRTVEDIDCCIELCICSNALSCVSVVEVNQHPNWMFKINSKGKIEHYEKNEIKCSRQQLPTLYMLNGAVYVANTDFLIKHKSFLHEDTHAYIMPPNRSIDVDSELDLAFTELLKTHNC